MLNASYLYAGYSDYFSGYGCADDADHSEHLLYAHYGRGTTLRSIIDELVEDSWNGPAGETLPDDITQDDVRAALLGMLSSIGRADYDSGAIAECSAAIEALDECPDCGESLDDDDYEDCPHCGASLDYSESPVFIVCLEYVKPEDREDCASWAHIHDLTEKRICMVIGSALPIVAIRVAT